MITLNISKSIANPQLSAIKESLLQAAQSVLEYTSSPANAELTILLTTNKRIQQLNRQFRNTDSPTDVLAFPARETDPETGSPYLGDVAISYPQALIQASAGNHPIDAELLLLVVHGVLHLCEYDHRDDDNKARMWAAQNVILNQLGSKVSSPVD